MQSQHFTFCGQYIEVFQDTDAEIDVTKNTGLKLWDGAYLLAKYLEAGTDISKEFWHGKSCVELGAGCGLVGTVTWLLGANTILTDLPDTIEHTEMCMKVNVDRISQNGVKSKLETNHLAWGSSNIPFNHPVDIIVGSDIIYSPETLDKLVSTLKKLSHAQTIILISYKPRGLGEDVFFTKLRDSMFTYKVVPREKYPSDFLKSDYVIYHIKKMED